MAPNPIAMTNIKALTKGFETTGKDLLKSNNSTSYADNDNNNKLNIIVMRDENNNNNNNQIVSTPDHSTNVNKNKNIVTTNEENDDDNNIIDDQQATSITSTDPVVTSNGSTDSTTTSTDSGIISNDLATTSTTTTTNIATNNTSNDYFTKIWINWACTYSVNKLTLPESVEDVLNSNRYIVNKHGWWPMFGGERTLKRKYDSFSSPSSPSSLSLFSPTFSKRQKLHNNPHHTSQFSARNYVTIKWYPLNDQLYVIAPIRTNTSSLPQNNFAAVTHRILAIKRLKSRQGISNKVKGFEPELHLPYDILVNDFEQYIENNTKSPWRDGTTEPRSGNIREIKSSRESTPEIDDENIDNSAGWLEESDDNNAGWLEDTENEDWDSTEYEILLSEAMNSIKNKNK
nr:11229_t:CDS:2 [Entrophospora candida]